MCMPAANFSLIVFARFFLLSHCIDLFTYSSIFSYSTLKRKSHLTLYFDSPLIANYLNFIILAAERVERLRAVSGSSSYKL